MVTAATKSLSVRSAAMVTFVVFASLVILIMASPAKAANLEVTNENDAGPGSLRDAISTANNNEADTITFDDDVLTITLTTGELFVSDDDVLTIDGGGDVTVSGNDQSRIFAVSTGANFTLNGITLSDGSNTDSTNGDIFSPGNGGAIFSGGTLTITDSTISDSSAIEGGGVYNTGALTINDSTIADNSGSRGGGIENRNALTINDSTVSNNSASLGGGVYNLNGTLTIDSSTISSNNNAEDGGGVFTDTDDVTQGDPNPAVRTTITNSTISNNEAIMRGGGVRNSGGLTVIENTTITDNTAPDGSGSGVASVSNDFTRTEVSSSIISGNTNSDANFFGLQNSFESGGYNLIGDGNATDAFDENTDQTGVTDPGLGELSDNGGETQTHALLASSPAIDQGNAPDLDTDQRGETRPVEQPAIPNAQGGDGSDVGAYELQETLAPEASVSPDSFDFDTSESLY